MPLFTPRHRWSTAEIQDNNLIQQSSQDAPLIGGVAGIEAGTGIFPEDADYEELLERLRVADFLYTQYTLEEVIYQLANVMFTQSLARGEDSATFHIFSYLSLLSRFGRGRVAITIARGSAARAGEDEEVI